MKKIIFTFFVLILSISILTVSVFATNVEELNQKKDELNAQITEANGQLQEIQGEMTTTLRQINELNETIRQYESDVQELSQKLENLQLSVDENERKLQVSEQKYNIQKQGLEERLVAIYEAGEISYLDVLLGSGSMVEFITNYYLVTELAKYDTELLEEMEKEKNNIEIAKKALEGQKEQAKTLKAKKEQMAVVLQNTKTVQSNYMAQLTDKERAMQERIDYYESQTVLVEQEIQNILLAEANPNYVGGVMAWPAPGYTRITSPYGMRTHPITGVYKLHTGVDIGAPIGANFIAANDGTVVKAEYNPAYGNMVLIDHGGGISTLYAHGSQIMVSVGQAVKRGDVVLKVGQTGYATGPHAHFEVRVNGAYVDPIPYITSNSSSQEGEGENN